MAFKFGDLVWYEVEEPRLGTVRAYVEDDDLYEVEDAATGEVGRVSDDLVTAASWCGRMTFGGTYYEPPEFCDEPALYGQDYCEAHLYGL